MSGLASKLLPLRIRLPYTTEDEFIEKYGSNVARGGVFVATRALKPEGTGLAFEFVLADGTRLLRGEGVVVKAQVDAGGGRAGMTVRFVKLDASSKALIDRLVARRSGAVEPARRVTVPATPPVEERAAPAAEAANEEAQAPEQEESAPSEEAGADEGAEAAAREEPAHPEAPQAVEAPEAVAHEDAQSETRAETSPAPESSAPPEDEDLGFDITASLTEPDEDSSSREQAQPAPAPQQEAASPASATDLQAAQVRAEPPAAPATPERTEPQLTVPATAHAEPPTATATPERVEPQPSVPVTARAEPPTAQATTARAEPQPTAEPEPLSSAAQDAEAVRNRRRALLDVPVTAPTPAPAIPEVVLGIDLGTSHARVAVFHEGTAKLVPLPGTDGTELPALVAVDGSGELLVGPAAQVEADRAPRRAATGLKRLLGLRARSPRLRELATQLPFPVSADPSGDASVELGGRLIAPTLFTALLLRELKHAAATFVGRKATRAVISVPSHFTDRQRAALREAATLAGLDAQRILTASAAAALAYGHSKGLARKRVLVVDLGGGGLEVCVVQVTGDDLEVITTGGDPAVGGMDFDARIAEALAADLDEQGVPRPQHVLDWAPLRTAAESAKVALSEREQVDVSLSSGTVPPLTRERIEALTADLAQRVTTVVREVLESNALSPQGLDAVLLVGGQGRAPLVRRRLEESLGVPVRDDVDPRGAVALGAALLGQGLLLAEAGKPAATVSEVLSAPIGVAERGGTLRRVLERNTRLPTSKTLVLPVVPGALELALFQGPSPVAPENEYLGKLSLFVERPGEAELHFSLTADGTLSLEATLPGAKRKPVSLAGDDLDDAARDTLIGRSPLEGEPEARPSGLLSGLKKLFGRR
ncbi:TIGR02266 family protein [Pyxidicoccus parkwayensis]|uniref:TIGR02266 family protein n=1 Tax=Pyxidicoccus parkwayensis TaxID=2813578 RepID=A0ABX7NZQ6_9BACT|nr:TIGR02266 family protein [Pyxidicoccus parkwaysis]QSQ23829.1 TIGR02266 family protein [Pyxidicoccus parkwaysis]